MQVMDALNGLDQRLGFLDQVGLGYISLDRPYRTLSGGEAQRSRLATQLGMGLVGVTYALDEPSVGLHPADRARARGGKADMFLDAFGRHVAVLGGR